ncbi:MAG: fimbrillin family protein, partial [Muribaculaceae bacterium]|nr:fimbrillin family protein [Muribaculaceae bacterium]
KAQKPLKYKHGTFGGNDHGTLVIPYTHAMSMITIEVVAADGFTTGNLGSTTATLQDMYKSATFSAPNATVSSQAGSQTVKMLASAEGTNAESKPNKMFQALVIPGKQLTAGNLLAEIANVDGNNYKIPVTQTIIDDWSEQLDGGNTLKSGVNYKLTVTVAKQAISVVAQITDWENIEAAGKGEIKFNSNIVSSGVTNDITSGSFEIFRGTHLGESGFEDVTKAEYSAGEWTLDPKIYWTNGTLPYYFRGLATTTDGTTPTATSSKAAAQGTDLLWATTPAHDGTLESGGTQHFNAGEAIPPRTGDVPLQFEHAMSKITVNLSTSTTGKATPTADESARAVDLGNVTVTISNIATAGTIAITDGKITPTAIDAAVPEAVTGTTPATVDYTAPIKAINGTIVIPQLLVNDTYPIKLTIKLSDGTTYSLPLKDCKVSGSGTNIETWNRGNHYVYNIDVEKEAIRFVAVLKNWVEVNGGGNANLDWD